MVKIKVIDAICGAGKTSYAIQMINDASKLYKISNEFGKEYKSDKKYIYVTPFLSEVERVVNNTKAEFSEPKNIKGSKIAHLKYLIEEEKSIVMTHRLFSKIDEDMLGDIEMAGYTLIMDEVANVIEHVNIESSDVKMLFESNKIEVLEDNRVKWLDHSYMATENSRFKDIKTLADNDNLYLIDNRAMFWTMNVKSFESFEEVYIMTYLFDGQIQKYYYDYFNVPYSKHSIIFNDKEDRYELIEYNSKVDNREKIGELLEIYQDYYNSSGRKINLNTNYDDFSKETKKKPRYYLSSSWFTKAEDKSVKQLRNNLESFFRRQVNCKNNELFWTTKKSFAETLKNSKCKINKKDDRTKDNYVALNARATNDYADRVATAYVYNRFMHPMEKKFFEARGVKVDEDLLAVSDLVQFLFRGCIRKGEVMHCYIPSPRMRGLLIDWLNYKI